MSFNGSGVFQINTSGQPVVANTLIDATVFNALTADLATGLSTCITKDGQTVVTNDITLSSHKLIGLTAGTAATHAVNLGQINGTTGAIDATFSRVAVNTWTEDGSYPSFVANKTVATASGHGFQDFNIFAGVGALQYNCFFGRAALSGATNFTHLRGGQMYLRNQSTGTVDEITSYLSQPNLYTGTTTTEINHFYVAASLAVTGVPSVVTEYGLRIAGGPLVAGYTWAIHSTWDAESKLGGGLQLANNKGYQIWDSGGTSRYVVQMDSSNDLYFGNSGISGNYYMMKGPRIPNANYYQAAESGGTQRNLIGLDGSNDLYIGSSGITGSFYIMKGPIIPNATYYGAKLAAGTNLNILGIDGSNDLYFGHSSITGSIFIGVNGTSTAGKFTSTGLNATVIGATTAAAGTFTTMNATSLNATAEIHIGGSADLINNDSLDVVASGTDTAFAAKNVHAAAYAAAIWNADTAGDNRFLGFYTEGGSGTLRGDIDYNRAGGAVRYNTTSDVSLKKNRKTLKDVGNIIDAIEPISWDWDKRFADGGGKGFSAQQVHKYIPDAVSPGSTDKQFGDDGYEPWRMDNSFMLPYAWAEIRNLRSRVAALEAA